MDKRPLREIEDPAKRAEVRQFREACEEAHAEGEHDSLPREGCPSCEDERRR